MLVKLEIPPGVYRNATEYSAAGRWYDTNLIRWIDGLMMPIGGWQKFSLTPVTGTCRGLFSWRDNANFRWLAIGTSDKLYVHDEGSLFDITPVGFVAGQSASIPGLGYGTLDYGEQEYGTQRSGTSGITLEAATWSFDSWGENLVGCSTSDGKVYEWSGTTSSPAAVIANAPIDNRFVYVSEQRHLVVLGAGGDPRKIQWSDAEDNTDWTPTSSNQAGDFVLNTNGHLRCGVKTRGETLILTSTDAHVKRFIGSPLVFSFDRVGTQCGVAGPNAAAAVNGTVVWLGTDAKPYVYNGVVQNIPCDIEDWLEAQFNRVKQTEVYCGTLAEQSEVWWYFPANDGDTKYAVWNYKQNIWYIGELDRTAWLDRGVWGHPVAVSSDGYLYLQENGNTDSGVTRAASIYAKAGYMEIGSGDNIMDVLQILPDEQTSGNVNVTIKTRFVPNGTEYTYGPYTVRADGYTDTRAAGRQASITIQAVDDADWRVGTYRADVRASGAR
jgi:hypothetical protein